MTNPHDIQLRDDGTLDTVFSYRCPVCGKEQALRYCTGFVVQHILAAECLDDDGVLHPDFWDVVKNDVAEQECIGHVDAGDEIPHDMLPAWIEPGVTWGDAVEFQRGHGCDTGLYMPAVTYYEARETMNEHEDEILDYIDGHGLDPFDGIPDHCRSWSGLACHIVSLAVEMWMNDLELPEFES